ncbi:MAG TPA: GntR family transcriptional regulator [Jatrophihabitantaceae bacterium]|nr:GntR family transcriptional regulator [Jatrophihabitantaceae bacterium]
MAEPADRVEQRVSTLRPVTVPTLVTAAVAEIRAQILAGGLGAGERLIEERLTESLGVSRAVVREALNALAATGLVRRRQRLGFTVIAFTAQDVHEILSLRRALERLAVELGVPSPQPDRVAAVRAAFQQLSAAVAAGDEAANLVASASFHRAVIALAGHGRLERAYDLLCTQMDVCVAYNRRLRERLGRPSSDTVDRHRRLTERIVDGDRIGALHELDNHRAGAFDERFDEQLDELLTGR